MRLGLESTRLEILWSIRPSFRGCVYILGSDVTIGVEEIFGDLERGVFIIEYQGKG